MCGAVLRRLRRRSSVANAEPIDEELFQIAGGILETPFARMLLPQHRTHLHVEIRIMLRRRPDGEDQVIGVAFGDLAGLGPGADDLRFLVDKALQRPAQLILDMRCPCSISLAKSLLSRGKSRAISSLRRM